jgi:molybdopterin molybdotransferase
MLEVDLALELVLKHAVTLPPSPTRLGADVLDRIVAEDVASDIDSPPFDKSIMDGYAVRAVDAAAGRTLTVIEEVAAGRMPARVVGAGQATRVMTGAPIPDGADAVIPHEETDLAGDTVRLRGATAAGQFILKRGREMKAGEVVVPAGTRLTPAVIGVLAAVGRMEAKLGRAPRLAIVSTGDEIVEPSSRPGPGQIRNSNGPMLLALAEQAGADGRYLGIARDEPAALAELARTALDAADVLILSGGVSAGNYDFVPDVLRDLGVQAHFHKVRMKPGKPLLFGTRGPTLVFGLPGNPVSSYVCFELFVRPALRKLSGYAITGPAFGETPLAADLKTRNDRPTYLPGRMEVTADGTRVRAAAWFGSADLRALVSADALIRVPPGDVALSAGTPAPTLKLGRS